MRRSSSAVLGPISMVMNEPRSLGASRALRRPVYLTRRAAQAKARSGKRSLHRPADGEQCLQSVALLRLTPDVLGQRVQLHFHELPARRTRIGRTRHEFYTASHAGDALRGVAGPVSV